MVGVFYLVMLLKTALVQVELGLQEYLYDNCKPKSWIRGQVTAV